MLTERNAVSINVLKILSTAELIEAYETAKQLELSDEFQTMLINAIKLRENDQG
jgi:hypothetical protein